MQVAKAQAPFTAFLGALVRDAMEIGSVWTRTDAHEMLESQATTSLAVLQCLPI